MLVTESSEGKAAVEANRLPIKESFQIDFLSGAPCAESKDLVSD
jgi:hypothetical protein